jgi:hypothetical protein
MAKSSTPRAAAKRRRPYEYDHEYGLKPGAATPTKRKAAKRKATKRKVAKRPTDRTRAKAR